MLEPPLGRNSADMRMTARISQVRPPRKTPTIDRTAAISAGELSQSTTHPAAAPDAIWMAIQRTVTVTALENVAPSNRRRMTGTVDAVAPVSE